MQLRSTRRQFRQAAGGVVLAGFAPRGRGPGGPGLHPDRHRRQAARARPAVRRAVQGRHARLPRPGDLRRLRQGEAPDARRHAPLRRACARRSSHLAAHPRRAGGHGRGVRPAARGAGADHAARGAVPPRRAAEGASTARPWRSGRRHGRAGDTYVGQTWDWMESVYGLSRCCSGSGRRGRACWPTPTPACGSAPA